MERKKPASVIPIRANEHGSNPTPPSGPVNAARPQALEIVDARRERRRIGRYSALLPSTQRRFEFALKRRLDGLAEDYDLDSGSVDQLAHEWIGRRITARRMRAAA